MAASDTKAPPADKAPSFTPLPIAGLHLRIVAFILDSIVVASIFMLFFSAGFGQAALRYEDPPDSAIFLGVAITFASIPFMPVLFAVLWAWRSQSVGMMAVGIIITTDSWDVIPPCLRSVHLLAPRLHPPLRRNDPDLLRLCGAPRTPRPHGRHASARVEVSAEPSLVRIASQWLLAIVVATLATSFFLALGAIQVTSDDTGQRIQRRAAAASRIDKSSSSDSSTKPQPTQKATSCSCRYQYLSSSRRKSSNLARG
jgi:hypothetical protein